LLAADHKCLIALNPLSGKSETCNPMIVIRAKDVNLIGSGIDFGKVMLPV